MPINRVFKNDKEKEYYFKAIVRNMNSLDKDKWHKINNHEISLGEVLYDNFCDNSNFDKELAELSLLSWIELIENPKLYKALKDLTVEDQIFISYIVKECKTQKELSDLYRVTQSAICQWLSKIIKNLKNKLQN